MKSYVITILDNSLSVKSAERCIRSAKTWGIEVEQWRATTPKDNPKDILDSKGILIDGFMEKYSRLDNCIAAFLSHYFLWEKCVEDNKEILILEHDAFFMGPLPAIIIGQCVNFGKPSYGRFNTPDFMGESKLVSKPYFGGAHAYTIKPSGARKLIEKAETEAKPTDIFLDSRRFSFLKEYHPWPIEARDRFTTIQKTEGCLAKHNYNEDYEIL
jgi:GR25 family glycosyltransferase involved in LPS biosynthesis